jgi:hypothetical protein
MGEQRNLRLCDPVDRMTEVTVPTALPLATWPDVELMHTGTWAISTGTFTFTSDDFYQAVAALDCPAVHNPVLKLGHNEPDPVDGWRWDGQPAIGWIGNMAVAEAGRTLVGDYKGMPGWFGQVAPSAYPHRSIEGQYDHRCQLGHVHPFVITAVALLGVTPPGIGTLKSLPDVAALYGVVAAAPSSVRVSGSSFALTIHAAAREDRVPNPTPGQVAAGVTTEDVRRSFYQSDYGRSWDIWIEEMQLGPDLQLIVCDDSTGSRSRVPVMIGAGDGEDAVSFGEAVKVVVRYEDAPTAVAAAAGSAPEPIRFASRAESRPGERPAAAEPAVVPPAVVPEPIPPVTADPPAQLDLLTPPAASAPEDPPQEGAGMDPALFRESLGLPPEATPEDITAALLEHGIVTAPAAATETGTEVAPVTPIAPALPEGTVTIDEAALALLQEQAAQGVAARAQQLVEDRDRTIGDAIRAGKIPPARKDHWEKAWAADSDGARTTLASLAPGLIPLQDSGAPGDAEHALTAEDESFDRLFSQPVPAAKGA